MRKSMIPSVSARVRHWGVAAVAAVIAAVWVTMSLIVPSLAQNDNSGAQPVSQSMNVQPAGSRIAGAAPLQLGTPSGMALTGATTRSKQYDTLLTGQAVHYSNGAAAYCAEPSKSSLAGATQGGIAYVDPSVAPYAMSASGSALSSADLQKLYKGLSDAAASTGGSGLVRDFALQKAAWELAGYPTTLMTKLDWEWATKSIRLGFLSKDKGYWLTKSQNEQADALAQQLIAQAKANAAKYQTNAEMLKSIQVQIVDGDKAGQKKVVLTGSDEAIAALKAGSDFAQTTITVTVNGKQVTGSVQQAVNGGIPVDVVCQDGKAKISAKWSGHIEVKGVYTSVPSNEDQAKIIVTPVQLQVQGSADVEVPCDTPSTPTPTPTPAKITVKTQAKDQADQDQEIVAGKPATIVDSVEMTGLVPGNEYTISGKLMNQETKAEVPGVIGSTTFTAKQANETQTVEFKLTAEQTKGLKAGVVFETLTQKTAGKDGDTDLNGKVVGSHEEITDGAQTITVKKPEAAPITVKTSAKDQTTGEKTIVKGKPATIVDTVTMTGLVPGNEYTISGVLMDKDTQKAVEGVTGSKTFTASKADETQDVTFTVPAEATKTLKAGVVFETLTQKTAGKDGDSELNGKVVADHKKIDDADQTVTVTKPEAEKITVKTQAKDKDTDSQTIVAGKPATVVDTVTMTGLVPGNEYTISGKLMNQETKAEVPGVIGSTTFTAKQANETQTVEFKLTAEQTKGLKAGVVFETLTQKTAGKDGDTDLNGKVVGSHEEITDGAQTITIKKPAPKPGSFTVAKKVVKSADTIKTPDTFGFEYFCGTQAPAAADWKSLEVKADGTTQMVSDVAAGSTCWLREKDAAVTGTELATSWQLNDAPAVTDTEVAGAVKFPVAEGATVKVQATNTYTVPQGALSISKKIVDQTDGKLAAGKTFSFPYVCATGADEATKVAEGTLKVTGEGTARVDTLPAGATCVIGEDDAAIADTSLATSWTLAGAPVQPADITWGGKTFKAAVKTSPIVKGAEVAVTATNTYADEGKAGFAVTKQVTGVDQAGLADQTFGFDYACGDTKGSFELKPGQTYSSITAGVALTKGATCTVTEKKPAAIEGVTFDGVTFNRTAGTGQFTSDKANSQVTFTIGDLKTPVTFTAVNTFVPVEKPAEPKAQTILATVDGAKEIKADDVAEGATVKLTDTIRYENLQAGVEYLAEGTLVAADGTDTKVTGWATFTPAGDKGQLVSGTVDVPFTLPAHIITSTSQVTAYERIWQADKVNKPTSENPQVTPKTPGDEPVAKHTEPDDKGQTITIVPKTQPKDVDLTLVKQVSGLGADQAGKSYDFTLACGDKQQNMTLTPGTPQTVKATIGAQCTLTETNAAVKGYTHQVSFAGQGLEVTATDQTATFTVPAVAGSQLTVTATNTYTPVEQPKVEIGTVASNANAADGQDAKTIEVGKDASIADVTEWKNLPEGAYVLVPTLKSVAGDQVSDVAGSKAAPIPFTVAKDQTTGQVRSLLTVPADQVVPGRTFVVFEKVYKAGDVTDKGVTEGATPVATHEDPKAESQTITVTTPPVKPSVVRIGKVAIDAQGQPIKDRDFSFDLACTNPDGAKVEKKNITVKSGAVSGDYEVVAGATCQITESKDKALIDGTAPVVAWTSDNTAVAVAANEMTGTFTVPEGDGVSITVTATNTYPKPNTPSTETPSTPTPSTTTPSEPTPSTTTPSEPTPSTTTPSEPTPSTTTPSEPTPSTTTPSEPTPSNPCEPTPTPSTSTPNQPATPSESTSTPGQPTPSTPTPGGNVPEWCTPKVSTSAKDQADGDQTVSSQGAVKIVDTVSWSNLAPGSYVVNGTLVDKATGEPVESATMTQAGHIEVTAYKQNGTVEMVFSVPEGVLKPGAEYVVFEDVFKAADADANGVANKGATPVAQHRDKDDAAQTVVVDKPKPSTPESTPNTPTPTTSTPTPTTPESTTPTPTPTTPCDETPTPTPSTTTPGQPATPTGPGETTPNTPGQTTPSHPECQPKVKTSAVDAKDGDKMLAVGADGKVRDQVTMTDFAKGEYVVVGTLMDKATGQPVPGAAQVEAKHVTIANDHEGAEVTIEFTVPAAQVKENASLVVFERVYRAQDVDANGQVKNGAQPYATHTDINDKAQTVTVPKPATPVTTPTPNTPESTTPTPTPTTPCDETPTPTPSTTTPGQPATPTGPGETTPNTPGQTTPSHPECQPKVKTSAVDAKDGDKMLAVGADGKVRDQVTMTDFAKGEYVVVGTLMDKATGQPVPGAAQVEAKHVTIANDHEGAEVTIEFTVPAAQVKENASLVVFERVYRAQDVDANGQVKNGAQPYATHTDINDKAQTVTVKVPKGTTTTGKVTPKPQAPIVKVHRFLAKTGVNAGVMAAVAAGVILAGFGLAGLRRRDS